MIQAYAANQENGKLELFEYDPGALKAEEVEIKAVNLVSLNSSSEFS